MMRALLVCGAAAAVGACFGGFDGAPPKAGTARGSGSAAARAGAGSGSGSTAKKKPTQSYKEAWTLICDAEKRSGATGGDRSERGAAVAMWIVHNLKNKQARYWFISFGRAKQEHREALFIAEAKHAGVDDCALRELLFGVDTGGAKSPSSAPAKGTSAKGRPPAKAMPPAKATPPAK